MLVSLNKQPIKSIYLIKSICAIGIISAHFSEYLIFRNFLPLYKFANGGWGSVFAQIFFIVSGAVLYYNYQDKLKVKNYYKKRWLSIFPMFYIAYISVEIFKILEQKNIFFRGGFLPYLYSFFGLDGYLSNVASTYYNVGEWFLGMIILLYIIFPFLLLLFKKLPLATMLSSIFLYVIFLNQSIINRVPLWSITSCLISFVLGMVIVKYKNQIVNKYSAMISFVAVIILNFIKLNQSSNVCIHLMSAYLFILLMFVGEWIMKNKILSKTFFEISSISYAVFLLQHRIIYGILSIFNPQSSLKIFTLLIATIFVILVASKLLTLFTDILKKGITKLIKHIRT